MHSAQHLVNSDLLGTRTPYCQDLQSSVRRTGTTAHFVDEDWHMHSFALTAENGVNQCVSTH